MKTIEISERALLIVFERSELAEYLPSGDFDISSKSSRMAIRSMLSLAAKKAGREMSPRVRLEMFGRADTEVNIFCTFCEMPADSPT